VKAGFIDIIRAITDQVLAPNLLADSLDGVFQTPLFDERKLVAARAPGVPSSRLKFIQ
jgi:hypothetical protein